MTLTSGRIVLLSLVCSAGAQGAQLNDVPPCPPSIRVAQRAVDSPPGWTQVDDESSHPLVNVRFSEGEPKLQVFLAPSRDEAATAVWNLAASATGYWLSCAYAETSVMVTRKLPDRVRSCRVEYDTAFSIPVVKRVACR